MICKKAKRKVKSESNHLIGPFYYFYSYVLVKINSKTTSRSIGKVEYGVNELIYDK